MDAAKRRGAYIKGESSDWIVKEVLSKKEHLLFFNPKGKGHGALLRNALTKELEDNFNALFPECGGEKTYAQIKEHFDSRRATMKKDMALIRSYTSGTGGGKDPAMEALVAKHESPSEADSLLMSLLKNTVGAFGVGDIMLETGHEVRVEETVEELNNNDQPGTSMVLHKKKKGKITAGGLNRAMVRSQSEWIRASAPLIAQNAARLGFGGGMKGRVGGLKREAEVEREDAVVKKGKNEEPSQVTLISSNMEDLQKKMRESYEKGQAAIAAIEHVRAMVMFGGGHSVSNDVLSRILSTYDAKVRETGNMMIADGPSARGGDEDDIVTLL